MDDTTCIEMFVEYSFAANLVIYGPIMITQVNKRAVAFLLRSMNSLHRWAVIFFLRRMNSLQYQEVKTFKLLALIS